MLAVVALFGCSPDEGTCAEVWRVQIVPLVAVVVDPAGFENTRVLVTGYLAGDKGDCGLYLNIEDATRRLRINGLALDVDDVGRRLGIDVTAMTGKCCVVEGIVDLDLITPTPGWRAAFSEISSIRVYGERSGGVDSLLNLAPTNAVSPKGADQGRPSTDKSSALSASARVRSSDVPNGPPKTGAER